MSNSPQPLLLDDLNTLEQQVVNTARRGEITKPGETVAVEDLTVTDDPKLRVRADLLRDLLLGLYGDLDPEESR